MAPEESENTNYGTYQDNPLIGLNIGDLEKVMRVLGAEKKRVKLVYQVLEEENGRVSWDVVESSLQPVETTGNTSLKAKREIDALANLGIVNYEPEEYVELTSRGAEIVGGIYETDKKIREEISETNTNS